MRRKDPENQSRAHNKSPSGQHLWVALCINVPETHILTRNAQQWHRTPRSSVAVDGMRQKGRGKKKTGKGREVREFIGLLKGSDH